MTTAKASTTALRCAFCGSASHELAACRMPGVAEFRARATSVAETAPSKAPVALARRWVGIDPGQDIGLVAVNVPGEGPYRHDIERGRLIAHTIVRAPTGKRWTQAAQKGEMAARVHRLLREWGATDVVVEENSDVTRVWVGAKGQKVRGQATGTVFWQGVHFGLCIAAARACSSVAHVWSYPATTPKRRDKVERTTGEPVRGWMQGHAAMATPRVNTLAAMGALLSQLKSRPESGVLPTLAELREPVSEHERMALGVLNYHLNRERGRV